MSTHTLAQWLTDFDTAHLLGAPSAVLRSRMLIHTLAYLFIVFVENKISVIVLAVSIPPLGTPYLEFQAQSSQSVFIALPPSPKKI